MTINKILNDIDSCVPHENLRQILSDGVCCSYAVYRISLTTFRIKESDLSPPLNDQHDPDDPLLRQTSPYNVDTIVK